MRDWLGRHAVWFTTPFIFLLASFLGFIIAFRITADPVNCDCDTKFWSLILGYGFFYAALNVFVYTKFGHWLRLDISWKAPIWNHVRSHFAVVYFISAMLFLIISAGIVIFVDNGKFTFF